MSREVPGRSQQYRQGCREYALGISLVLFATSTLVAHLLVWKQYLPSVVHETAFPFFVIFSVAGFVVVAAAYKFPVRFYEYMEAANAE